MQNQIIKRLKTDRRKYVWMIKDLEREKAFFKLKAFHFFKSQSLLFLFTKKKNSLFIWIKWKLSFQF